MQSDETVKIFQEFTKYFCTNEFCVKIFSAARFFIFINFTQKYLPRTYSSYRFFGRGPGQNPAGATFGQFLEISQEYSKFSHFNIFVKVYTFAQNFPKSWKPFINVMISLVFLRSFTPKVHFQRNSLNLD